MLLMVLHICITACNQFPEYCEARGGGRASGVGGEAPGGEGGREGSQYSPPVEHQCLFSCTHTMIIA